MEALFCLFLSKNSDSDSNWLYVWLLSHSLLMLIVPSGSNSILPFLLSFSRYTNNGLPLTNCVTTNSFSFLNMNNCRHA